MKPSVNEGIRDCVEQGEPRLLSLNSPTPRTHSDILQVPTDLFNVNAAVKGHPATTEKPKQENVSIILGWT